MILLAAVLCLLTVYSTRDYNLAARFEAEGVEVSAVIVGLDRETYRNSEGRRRTRYSIDLGFVTESGERISITRTVGRQDYEQSWIGKERQLMYLPGDPTVVQMEAGDRFRSAWIMQLIVLGAGIGWLYGLWKVGRWTVNGYRARQYGEKRSAKVQEVVRAELQVNGIRFYRLIWVDDTGEHGRSIMFSWFRKDRAQPGDNITIFRGPDHTWWEGDVGPRAEPRSRIPKVRGRPRG